MEAFLVVDTLTPNQQRTAAARAALAAKFPDAETKSDHYRRLAEKANAGRVVLPADEAQALAGAWPELVRLTEIVGRIAERVERRSVEEGAA